MRALFDGVVRVLAFTNLLAERGWFGKRELVLLEAWIDDVELGLVRGSVVVGG